MQFNRDLGRLLKRGDFRRLFAVRLTSQFGDGVFQVALASYVLFSPERAPDAAAIAGLFAVALLPYSVLGPFTGVLLDRWSRRQILFAANVTRAALVLIVGAVVAVGNAGIPFYLMVLLTLGVNRFLLSGLSASLPHVVDTDELVMANAVTPTSGTALFLIGGGVGAGVKLIVESDLAVLGLTSAIYLTAALLALRLARNQLGPDLNGDEPGVLEALGSIATGLVDGGRHLRQRPQPALGLAAIGSLRFLFGLVTVAMILLYRNEFYGPDQLDQAFGALALATGAVGAGLFLAALVTPWATRVLTLRRWITVLFVAAAVVTAMPGGLYTQPALLVAGFLTGFCAQGVKISVDTLVQTGVDDVYRGRVFSLYDMIFNVGQVSAAALGAVILPDNGKSYPVLVFIVFGFLVTALIYARLSSPERGDRLDGGGFPGWVGTGDQPDQRAQ
ncbi:MFS-type transporter involved in bile tolerance (Atg22 family) [Kribbella sp. VKM Ac-2527]|uniref:MFS-type transporter involved in bile tolerance (Atg22 family) n=1 Tax=Kribbella caucasensis TaxID=2512215 RepID=A0A4R6KQG2_9ACTN|nr:MFS transporter [Kribbella sp. VKM Ac-2527]TDO54832.1 MFS-type transporter involved in bile tolerance (Atg22 family) [Kribbella sp. VKM Ac-2527]